MTIYYKMNGQVTHTEVDGPIDVCLTGIRFFPKDDPDRLVIVPVEDVYEIRGE